MSADEPTRDPHIDVHYIKASRFREISCDGVMGGPTPNGRLWLAFFTERFPIPRIVRHALKSADEDGGQEIDHSQSGEPIESREGVIRNVEFGVYLSIESAEKLHEWLGRRLSVMKEGKE